MVSPLGRGPSTPTGSDDANSQTIASHDYLKNVLLQFLEQKDKKHQMQLIPVLGMLLHFNRYAAPFRSDSIKIYMTDFVQTR